MNSWYLLAQAGETGGESSTAPTGAEPAGGQGAPPPAETPAGQETQTITQQPDPGAPGPEVPKKQPSPLMQLMPFILIFAVIYIFMFRGPRKRQQEQQRMLQSLQKNTRVRTIGGIIGTIVDVRDEEVVLKIDEANNVKMRVARSAIGKVLTGEENQKS